MISMYKQKKNAKVFDLQTLNLYHLGIGDLTPPFTGPPVGLNSRVNCPAVASAACAASHR
jgi:hypothetical protein